MDTPNRETGHSPAPGAPMGADEWDERYRSADLVWGAGANRWVQRETADLPPGRALDLACGEGRNVLWLAGRGWQVTGVDFSPVAVGKAAALERIHPPTTPARWICADATTFSSPDLFDLVLVIYLHLPAAARRQSLVAAAAALAPGGVLLVVGHHTANIAAGVGGPQNPAILFTEDDIVGDLAEIDPTLDVDRAERALRDVDGADRPAIDALVRVHRPHR